MSHPCTSFKSTPVSCNVGDAVRHELAARFKPTERVQFRGVGGVDGNTRSAAGARWRFVRRRDALGIYWLRVA